MTGSSAIRLFWKEYRVQRGLWLSLAIGTLLLHGIIRAMTDSNNEIGDALWFLAGMLTCFFSIGAASVTFASEREDGTHLRLMTLSPSPTVTYFVKLLSILLATAALLTVTGASALLMSKSWYAPDGARFYMSPAMKLCVWIAASIGAGMLFSLIFRHVFATLLSAAITTIIVMGTLSVVWNDYETQFRDRTGALPDFWNSSGQTGTWHWELLGINALFASIVLAIYMVNLFLAHRWLTRAFFDDGPSRIRFWIGQARVRTAAVGGGVTVELGVQSDLTTPVLTPEEAVIQPAPRWSLGWLYMLQGRRGLRPFRFLRWKELTETRIPFAIGVCVVALISIAATEAAIHAPDGAHYILLLGIPAVLGLLTFRGEQRHERFRLLADHGLSRRTVWFSKHAVWLPRVIALMLLVFVLSSIGDNGLYPIRRILSGVYCFDPRGEFHHRQYSEFARTFLGEIPLIRCVIITLVLYAIGHAASLTFRRGVLAAFATILGGILTMVWTAFCSAGGIPLTLALLPIVPALLLFTYRRAASWLIDNNQRRVWLTPCVVLAVGLIGCVGLTSAWRVLEVPAVAVDQIQRTGLSSEQITALCAEVGSEESGTADLYHQAWHQFPYVDLSVQHFHTADQWNANLTETETWVQKSRASLALIRQAADRPHCVFPQTGTDRINKELSACLHLVLRAALIEGFDGRHDEALALFRDAFTLCRHCAGRGNDFESWGRSRRYSKLVLKAMAWWATQPDVDAEWIVKATDIIRSHLGSLPSVSVLVFANHERLRNLIDEGPEAQAEHSGPNWRYDFDPTHRWLYRFPGENARMQRIVNYSDKTQAEMVLDLSAPDRGESIARLDVTFRSLLKQEQIAGLELNRLKRTTPTLRGGIHLLVTGATRAEVVLRTEAAATIAIMHLLLQERLHGALPETLDNLPAELNDPWTGKPFVWYPQGLPQRLPAVAVTVEADRPFLFSPGAGGAHIVRNEQQVGGYSMEGAGWMGSDVGSDMGMAPGPLEGNDPGPVPHAPAAGEAGAATEPDTVETVVTWDLQFQHNSREPPAAFMLPRPESE